MALPASCPPSYPTVYASFQSPGLLSPGITCPCAGFCGPTLVSALALKAAIFAEVLQWWVVSPTVAVEGLVQRPAALSGEQQTHTLGHKSVVKLMSIHKCCHVTAGLWWLHQGAFKATEKHRLFVSAFFYRVFPVGLPSKYWLDQVWQDGAVPCHLPFQYCQAKDQSIS